jgi:hypothetical protein
VAVGGWTQLSENSRRAFQFAWAAAQERTGHEPDKAEVNTFDLLVGIVLAQPGASEAEATFRHFGLVVGQALPSGYPLLTADILKRHLGATSPDATPPAEAQVDDIVQAAIQMESRPDPDGGGTEASALWVALLAGNGDASTAVHGVLRRRGVSVSELATDSQGWLAGGGSEDYATILQKFPGMPVDIANYEPDMSPRPDPARPATVVDDYIGISAEVDAFAYLLASRGLQPPLAVGLFGDWGSGKSYFLDAIRRRIDQLTQTEIVRQTAQRDTLFWKRIVQVEFNAWHFAEVDLWSSLVHHIFTQLNLASENTTDSVVVERQRYLFRQLETTAASIAQLELTKKQITGQLSCKQQRVLSLQKQRDAALEERRQAEAADITTYVITSSRQLIVQVLESQRLGSSPDDLTIGASLDALTTARAQLEDWRSLVRPFLRQRGWLVLLLVCILGTPLVVAGIERLTGSPAGAAFGGIASLLTVFCAAIGFASRWVQRGLDEVAKARQKVDADRAEAQKAWQTRLREAEESVARVDQNLHDVTKDEAVLRDQLAKIEQDLQKGPAELLNEFLRERQEAGDYRKRLGLPSLIRRDFRSLAELISEQNRYLLESPEQQRNMRTLAGEKLLDEENEWILNRIILYIDDLDRCPDSKVIEVLQAVHMLLAFPLFVVVVAVDARWLAHALQSRYPALAHASQNGMQRPARPDDYLEKIFQIPFWVQPLTDGSRSMIIRGLLRNHVRAGDGEGTTTARRVIELGPAEEQVLTEMLDPRTAPPQLDVKALQVTRDELTFLESLTPLMANTPRSVKRFVNVFQLIKMLRRGRAAPAGNIPSDVYVAAFLLAVAEGLPEIGARLFNDLASGSSTMMLTATSLIDGSAVATSAVQLEHLRTWLAGHADMGLVDTKHLAEVAADVRRFVFRVVGPASPDGDTTMPQLIHVIQER